MKAIHSIAVALALLALTLTATTVSAADRVMWRGQDSEGYRYEFHNTSGDSWAGSISGGRSGSGKYTEVTRTEDFIEVHLDGNKDERTRIYKDKILFWSRQSGKWIEMASGKWSY